MKKSFVFPGQGSQKVGMGTEIYNNFRTAKDVFEEVNDSLSKNLSKIIFKGPQEELTLTQNAQPAIMAVSMAVIRVLENDFQVNIKKNIDFIAGHSLGEYTALAASKSISLTDTAKILFYRGKNMQESTRSTKTGMAAFMGANFEKIKEILVDSTDGNEVCDIANYNTDSQIVLSGDEVSINKAIAIAEEIKVKAVKLEVSAPFHSSYMKDTAEALKNEFQKYNFRMPNIPIISNFSAKPFSDEKDIINSLVKQTYSTVRWYESIKYINSMNVNAFYEIGFGKTLCGIIKRIDRNLITRNLVEAVQIESFAKEIL
ncbi:MAG: [acyl-carrier-protein] S-malonyltransferase [Pelagibacterales bacterium]|mgnify:CR=1 FL=1|nr:[acyl-carrier-protein] S-malonyltransferase [Pelagibacterales bacterium]